MQFYKTLKTWYIENNRDLPWRKDVTPYVIWLSEIILQQTKVDQGVPYFERILSRFPTISELANSSEKELLNYWQGLGYYSRALNMHKASKYIVNELNGEFPDSYKGLLTLPGVGPYTAAAIASFSYREKVPVLDGNVYRFMSRFYGITEPINTTKSRKLFTNKLNALIPSNEPDVFNQGMMEFGALMCKPRNANCQICPFNVECVAYHTNSVYEFPKKKSKPKSKVQYKYFFEVKIGEKVLIKQRDKTSIWKGLFEFPSITSEVELSVNDLMEMLPECGLPPLDLIKSEFELTHKLSHIDMYAKFYSLKLDTDKALSNSFLPIGTNEFKGFAFHRLMTKYFESNGYLYENES